MMIRIQCDLVRKVIETTIMQSNKIMHSHVIS
jgi:hypothetical protein